MTRIFNLHEMKKPIDLEAFTRVFNEDTRHVIDTVRKYGFDVRVVGGAVRDFMLNRVPRDVDFATDAEPAELIFIFDLENIPYDAGGIKHGTIKAVFGRDKIDVTSITYRLRLDKGKLEIQRPESWKQESARRDLTINSMSVDMDGNLYDYQGGLADLDRQMVRFCPNPQDKIDQDPFTMLRWFKGLSIFERPRWKASDRRLIERNVEALSAISDTERARMLINGLQRADNWRAIRRLMCDMGVARKLDVSCE